MKLDSVKTRQQENPHLEAAEVEINQDGTVSIPSNTRNLVGGLVIFEF